MRKLARWRLLEVRVDSRSGGAAVMKIDALLIFVVLLIVGLASRGEYLLAILLVLGIIFIELAAIRRAIEDKS